MDGATALLGMGLMCLGAIFVTVAAIGVFRLPDAFQRMHASTKAGTLGAALVVTGAVITERDISPAVAIVTIVFLVVTLSVAAQLLGRAAYVSGATIARLERADPLEDVLDREKMPLEERLARIEDSGGPHPPY